jgi:phage baseplate assembly protein gpV
VVGAIAAGGYLEIQELVPQVELLWVVGEEVLEEGAAEVAVAVGRPELEGRELGYQGEVQVSLGTEDLGGALQEGAGTVGRVLLGVEEVGVVDPDFG